MPRVALATYDPGAVPSRDRDLGPLVRALRAAGADAEAVHWDDAGADWAAYDLVVIRSTWDYSWRAEEFVAWAERCAKVTRLANPADVVRWNTDKRYLGDLAAAGVPVVPTRYLAPGDPAGAGDLPGGHDFVVKPVFGAGARLAARYAPAERETAAAQVARLHADGLTVMVQPYLSRIDVSGERALQFFGGRLLHASRKRAVLSPGTAYDAVKVAHPDLQPWTPTPAELAVAEKALAAVPGAPELLCARVDLVDGQDGSPCVMELELVEPNLFLWLHPGSEQRVAREILAAAVVPTASAGPRPASVAADPT
ncbi:RimK family alpha-L-glutamate ligase [Streptomyces sp. NPDC056160]|uniref:ATP-grasp domain-containing protein n=1 Tax=Streptomyces sp. NPDC056160 TaxID=3345731 RepID=UPI0035E2CA7F